MVVVTHQPTKYFFGEMRVGHFMWPLAPPLSTFGPTQVTHLFGSLHGRFSRHMALHHMGHHGHHFGIHAQIQHGGAVCCTTMSWLRA